MIHWTPNELLNMVKFDAEVAKQKKHPYKLLVGDKIKRNKQYQKRYRERHHDEILARQRSREEKKNRPQTAI